MPHVEEEAGPEPTLVPRVDRDKHDARITALKNEIAALEVTRTAVLGRIEGSKASQDASNVRSVPPSHAFTRSPLTTDFMCFRLRLRTSARSFRPLGAWREWDASACGAVHVRPSRARAPHS